MEELTLFEESYDPRIDSLILPHAPKNPDLWNLYLVKRTQIEMIRDRGFTIPDNEQLLLDKDYAFFRSYVSHIRAQMPGGVNRDTLTMIYSHPTDTSSFIYVRYLPNSDKGKGKISKQLIELAINDANIYQHTLSQDLLKRGVTAPIKFQFVLIIPLDISPEGWVSINTVAIPHQVFFESELTTNPIKHTRHHPMTLLSEEAQAQILTEMKSSISDILSIYDDDPAIRYYNWPVGRMTQTVINLDGIGTLVDRCIIYRCIKQRDR